MFCPWKKSYWSDNRYKQECDKFEIKHQCMIKNNVIILRSNEISNLESVFGK